MPLGNLEGLNLIGGGKIPGQKEKLQRFCVGDKRSNLDKSGRSNLIFL